MSLVSLRLPREVPFGVPPDRVGLYGVDQRGTTHRKFRNQTRAILRSLPDADERIWAQQAQDREAWRNLVWSIAEDQVVLRTTGAGAPGPAPPSLPEGVEPHGGAAPLGPPATAPGDTLTCPSCGFRALTPPALSGHITAARPVSRQQYRCEVCNLGFQSRGGLTRHNNQNIRRQGRTSTLAPVNADIAKSNSLKPRLGKSMGATTVQRGPERRPPPAHAR